MDGYTQAEDARALDRIWADIQASDPDGADAARVPTYAELAEVARVARIISIRWELEAEGAMFPGAGFRGDLRAALARIGGGA